ncbi:MAG: hypothetical protein RR946_12645, partial [Clostridia bacterium]
MPACKKLLSLAITLVVLFGSCASAISVDSEYILGYLYEEKMQTYKDKCTYLYADGMYVYNIAQSKAGYESAISPLDQNEGQGEWKIDIHLLTEACAESKALIDQEGRTNESVIISVTYNIGNENYPVIIPLLTIKDGIVVFNINDALY